MGAVVTPSYDSLLEKITAWAPTPEEVAARMSRALREYRIRGVKTNLLFLNALITHPSFLAGDVTTRFVDETPELFDFAPRQDRGTRLLAFMGDVLVNGNPEVEGQPDPGPLPPAPLPDVPHRAQLEPGTRGLLKELGPEGFARWMREQDRLLLTDTSFRDAHQSLLATRVRTHDLLRIAPIYARQLDGLLSLECWGGATFDVAMRFLKEDPWDRLAGMRERVPNILLQMLLRSSNAVGYTNYPDNVVQFFVAQAAEAGVDLFRVFDSLNWVENMRVAMDAVLESGAICEAAICYTGDILDPTQDEVRPRLLRGRSRASSRRPARTCSGIKDMAGLLQARGGAAAGARAARGGGHPDPLPHPRHQRRVGGQRARGSRGGSRRRRRRDGPHERPDLPAQPGGDRRGAAQHRARHRPAARAARPGGHLLAGGARATTRGFESPMRAGASEVYEHEMPGGQYTNLRQQAQAIGIAERWPEVARAYAQVNDMLGDIIKVTPTSKAVGDLAVLMVTNDLTAEDVLDPERDIAFPESIVEYFHGDVGQPPGGFPEGLQRKVLKGREPLTVRPGEALEPVDLEATREEVAEKIDRPVGRPGARLLPHVPGGVRRVRRLRAASTATSACCPRRSSSGASTRRRSWRSRSSTA